MLDAQALHTACDKARKTKKKISNYLPGSKCYCDCTKCFGKSLARSARLIKKHISENGRHHSLLVPNLPLAAGPSRPHTTTTPSPPLLLDTEMDNISDVELEYHNNTACYSPSHPGSPAANHQSLALSNDMAVSRSCSRSLSRSHSRSLSRSHSRSLSRSRSELGSRPRSPAPDLCPEETQSYWSRSQPNSAPGSNIALDHPIDHPVHSPHPDNNNDSDEEEDFHFRPADAILDAELFGQLLYNDRQVEAPPPLRLRGGYDDAGDVREGEEDDDEGDEPEPDQPDEDEQVEQPEIQVEPFNIGGEPEGPGDDAGAIPALDEHPTLLNIYLRTWALYAFSGSTESAIQAVLESKRSALLACAGISNFPPEFVAQIHGMPITLRALERRIGMDFSELITVYPLCPIPECGKRYTSEELSELQGPRCVRRIGEDQCEGILFTESTLASGARKRTPTKSFPYNSLPHALSRLLSRVGMVDFLQHWRRAGNEPTAEDVPPPLDPADWFNTVGPEDRFGDISQARGWRSQGTGFERLWNGNEYEDVPIGDEPLALSRLPLGLNLSLNMDGFQAFRGKFAASGSYSVNGVYIVVNNLPFHLRMLIENMILAMVMPGPKEPKGYALDQILEPLVDDFIELAKGINMPVYNSQTGRIENRIVYANLSALLLDWIARIKCTGHVGVTAEHNHCLYCKIRQCDLSLPRGYLSEGFNPRDPLEHLVNKCRWLNAPVDEREDIRQETGTTFVDFDRIPGFYSFNNCPIDAMHIFDLGITPSIVRDILYKPGMLRKRYRQQPIHETPEARFNAFVERTYFPAHCSRLPAELSKMGSRTKAEQWRTLRTILVPALFEAWRFGDTIPDVNIPRGGRNTKNFKAQQSAANQLLRRRRHAHDADEGDLDNIPQIEDCASSRNPRDYMACVIRFCVATHGLFRSRITQQAVTDMTALLELVGVGFARMNVHLPPSFHTATHIGDHILKYGNVSGTWLNRFEQANRVLVKINTNGHGRGVLEATMAKGWARRAECYRYVKLLQAIENPTDDDLVTLNVLLGAMKDGPEHELQRGILDAILAGEALPHGLEPIRLANQSSQVDFHSREHNQFYRLAIQFCNDHNPFDNVVFYGPGREPDGGVYIAPAGSTRSYSHFFRHGVRYGSTAHFRGYKARYGYIENRVPVIIRGIYEIMVRALGEEHKFLSVMVQRFTAPNPPPLFLWDYWDDFMGIHAWAFDQLGPLEAVPAYAFSGVFCLSDIDMTYGRYWITSESVNTAPADRVDDYD